MSTVPRPSPATLAGVFLLSAAVLLYEVGLTRLFSLVLWHQAAALVVSVAFLGFGASGTLAAVLRPGAPERAPGWGALAFAAACVVAYLAAQAVPFDPARVAWAPWHALRLGLHALVLAVPFLIAGWVIVGLLARFSADAGRVYAADLAGAAAGACAVIPALALGGTGPVFGAAGLAAGAAVLLSRPGRRILALTAAASMALAAAALHWPPPGVQPHLSEYSELALALTHPEARHPFSAWNALGRVDVVQSPALRDAPGLSLTERRPVPRQAGVAVDGGGLSGMLLDPADTGFLDRLPSAAPYAVLSPRRVLVIEPGGGLEVWNALAHGVREVTAVIANPLVRQAVDANAANASPYLRPGVRVVHGNERAAARLDGVFDLVVLAGAAGGPTSTGSESVAHEFGLTVEAFREHLQRLAPDGLLVVSRYLIPPPRGELRMLALVRAALSASGADEPADHLAVLRSWGVMVVIAGRSPLSREAIGALRAFCEERRFDLVHLPGLSRSAWNRHNRLPAPLYAEAAAQLLREPARFIEGYRYDIDPPTDAAPYFSHFLRFERMGEVLDELRGDLAFLLNAGYLLPAALAQVVVLSMLLLIAPLGLRKGGKAGRGRAIAYFAAIGVGYMSVEMALLVPVSLLLPSPVHAFALVLAALLLGSGAGSLLSARLALIVGGERRLIRGAPWFIALAAGVLAGAVLPLVHAALGWPEIGRIALALLLVMATGVAMGIPFPSAVRRLGAARADVVPWAWAANGCASVAGVLAAPLIALAWGFPGVLLAASAAYGLAGWMGVGGPGGSVED